jgi:hypothetical protein
LRTLPRFVQRATFPDGDQKPPLTLSRALICVAQGRHLVKYSLSTKQGWEISTTLHSYYKVRCQNTDGYALSSSPWPALPVPSRQNPSPHSPSSLCRCSCKRTYQFTRPRLHRLHPCCPRANVATSLTRPSRTAVTKAKASKRPSSAEALP